MKPVCTLSPSDLKTLSDEFDKANQRFLAADDAKAFAVNYPHYAVRAFAAYVAELMWNDRSGPLATVFVEGEEVVSEMFDMLREYVDQFSSHDVWSEDCVPALFEADPKLKVD